MADLRRALRERAAGFEFYQAVRLLELEALERGRPALGGEAAPGAEPVRLAANPSLAFPEGALESAGADGVADDRMVLLVNFLGLVGPSGVLPRHYTELVIRRGHLRDRSLRDLLDVLHHRTLSLFYRAWRKYRLPFSFEHSSLRGDEEDLIGTALGSLVGLGTPSARHRRAIDDSAWTYLAGHASRRTRTAVGLEDTIEELFGTPARVEPFVGQWIDLDEGQRSRMPRRGEARGPNTQLGSSLVLGSRVWDVSSGVRLVLGPMSRESLLHLSPPSRGHAELQAVVHGYLDAPLAVELVLLLAEEQSPGVRLGGGETPDAPRLGRDTWVEYAPRPAAHRTTRTGLPDPWTPDPVASR